MKNNITYEMVQSLEDILGNGNKFKAICDKLGIDMPRSLNSKNAILSQLKQYCDIKEIKENGKHPVYMITQIYDNPLLTELHANNKFQPYVEQAILQLALDSHSSTLYLSNSAILEATYLVNNNFKIACSSAMNKLNERQWIQPEANELYNILYKWIKLRLKQMDARHLIQLQKGYRLYKTIVNDNDDKYVIYKNVAKNSQEDKDCQEIYAKAIQKTKSIPKDWDGGWLHPTVYEELKRNANMLCKEFFVSEGWEKINVVNVIIPVQNESLLKKRLSDVDKVLNSESKRKTKETSKLNHLTGFQRQQITDEIISLNPTVDYKKLLEQIDKEI